MACTHFDIRYNKQIHYYMYLNKAINQGCYALALALRPQNGGLGLGHDSVGLGLGSLGLGLGHLGFFDVALALKALALALYSVALLTSLL